MARNLGGAALLLLLAAAAWSVWQQLDRPVRNVRVEGPLTAAEQAAIRDVVAASLDAGVLSLDAGRLRERIHALSWPRAVHVRRDWPDTLVIRVEKESVIAEWGDGGYLTTAGKVVRLAADGRDTGGQALPALVTVLSPPRRAMELYQMLQSRVGSEGLSIARLEENELGEWQATFTGGITVSLGSEALRSRLERFLVAYRHALADRAGQVDRVDARYDNGVAVHWRDTSARGETSARGDSMEATYALR